MTREEYIEDLHNMKIFGDREKECLEEYDRRVAMNIKPGDTMYFVDNQNKVHACDIISAYPEADEIHYAVHDFLRHKGYLTKCGYGNVGKDLFRERPNLKSRGNKKRYAQRRI